MYDLVACSGNLCLVRFGAFLRLVFWLVAKRIATKVLVLFKEKSWNLEDSLILALVWDV